VRVVRALYESARSGTAVALPPFPRKKKPSIVQEFGPPTASQNRRFSVSRPRIRVMSSGPFVKDIGRAVASHLLSGGSKTNLGKTETCPAC